MRFACTCKMGNWNPTSCSRKISKEQENWRQDVAAMVKGLGQVAFKRQRFPTEDRFQNPKHPMGEGNPWTEQLPQSWIGRKGYPVIMTLPQGWNYHLHAGRNSLALLVAKRALVTNYNAQITSQGLWFCKKFSNFLENIRLIFVEIDVTFLGDLISSLLCLVT